MRPSLMVPQFRPLSSLEKEVRMLKTCFFSMLLHFPKVLRPLVKLWPSLSQETQPSLPRNSRPSQPMLIINQVCSSKFSKVNDRWQRITIYLVHLTLREFHLHHVVLHKLKSLSISMQMVFLTYLQLIKLLVKPRRLLSPTIRDVFPRKRLRRWSKMLRSSRTKMRS